MSERECVNVSEKVHHRADLNENSHNFVYNDS